MLLLSRQRRCLSWLPKALATTWAGKSNSYICWHFIVLVFTTLPFAYSYDDLIEFLRFPHLSSVMGCSALGPVCYCFLLLPPTSWTSACLFSVHEHLSPACLHISYILAVLQASGSIFLFLQIAILPCFILSRLCLRLDDTVLSPFGSIFFLFIMQVPKACTFAWHCGLEIFCGPRWLWFCFCFSGVSQFIGWKTRLVTEAESSWHARLISDGRSRW